MMDIARKIGIRIRELRKQRGISQQKLAELSGIEHKHIQVLESSKPTNARIDSLEKIANAFHISLQDFFSHELFSKSPLPSLSVKKSKGNLKALSSLSGRKILFQDKYTLAFFGYPEITRGHCILISKRGVGNYFELFPEERYSLWDLMGQVVQFLDREFKPDGYNIGMNIGEAAGQKEEIFILHVIPRYKGDCRNPSFSGICNVLKN